MPKFRVYGFFEIEAEDADTAGDLIYNFMSIFPNMPWTEETVYWYTNYDEDDDGSL